MAGHGHERPLGGKILTPAFKFLLALCGLWVVMVVVRLFFGLGAVSAQSDGYAWGIWKPLNVVTFTGIAAGAYAVGLVTYLFNKGEYHPLVRSAVMAGAMGYTLAGTSVLIDLGRWWNLWVVFWPPVWNLNSVLLEVAICVMAYTMVLWVEVGPVRPREARVRLARPAWRRSRVALLPPLERAMPFVVATAILLPTMHQSSLGGLFMVAETKTHPLWHTSWLSGLFLVSCVTMGFGAVVLIENLAAIVVGEASRPAAPRAAERRAGVAARSGTSPCGSATSPGGAGSGSSSARGMYSFFFLLELALFLAPGLLLLSPRWRANRGKLFGVRAPAALRRRAVPVRHLPPRVPAGARLALLPVRRARWRSACASPRSASPSTCCS